MLEELKVGYKVVRKVDTFTYKSINNYQEVFYKLNHLVKPYLPGTPLFVFNYYSMALDAANNVFKGRVLKVLYKPANLLSITRCLFPNDTTLSDTQVTNFWNKQKLDYTVYDTIDLPPGTVFAEYVIPLEEE